MKPFQLLGAISLVINTVVLVLMIGFTVVILLKYGSLGLFGGGLFSLVDLLPIPLVVMHIGLIIYCLYRYSQKKPQPNLAFFSITPIFLVGMLLFLAYSSVVTAGRSDESGGWMGFLVILCCGTLWLISSLLAGIMALIPMSRKQS